MKENNMTKIPEAVRPKLIKAINELLRARQNTHQVRDLLSKQASFGKFEGCAPQAILDLANGICKAINAENSRQFRKALAESKTAQEILNQ